MQNSERLERERAKAVEAEREEQAMRKDWESNLYAIRRTVKKLDTALRTNSKAKHIPEEYKELVRDFCRVFAENAVSQSTAKEAGAEKDDSIFNEPPIKEMVIKPSR